ncbi:MAG: hypothetical protein UT48_C0010G0062 [Parcubacteria group bacterium GW2011_GWE2_39_37]|uniref:DUF721 domain-containing protein n=1 Tax=Candidatus Falkowbacteria bacterium GW2011_GWF2_39_8 TaxID=1618642 RepID=A0A0G0T681_9BACT|nr:MAG: hypothetical protein UT48_C0010G0062 [Parcubacteria group bacterium GW2011_GWE2_39_37]KKR33337.1 MAG: hypothetical protein UT64_C0010G0011 [Candidatus Falkowbacteria bacterium GW2011_GWF2_39_8]
MFNDIQSIFLKTIKRSGLGKRVEEAQVLESFNKVIDQLLPGDLRDKVRPMYFNQGSLAVASLSSFATDEIKAKESEIIKIINQELAGFVVKKFIYLT